MRISRTQLEREPLNEFALCVSFVLVQENYLNLLANTMRKF